MKTFVLTAEVPPGAEDPLASIERALAFASKDWSLDRRDAWIWGIVLGWDDALPEVAAKHRWDAIEIERLQRLHAKWTELRGGLSDGVEKEVE